MASVLLRHARAGDLAKASTEERVRIEYAIREDVDRQMQELRDQIFPGGPVLWSQ